MARPVKITPATLAVLRVLVDDLASAHYGLQISGASGVKTGTLYPILNRLEIAGWITGEWEKIDPRVEGRPRRRMYKVTNIGAQMAITAARESAKRTLPRAVLGSLSWELP